MAITYTGTTQFYGRITGSAVVYDTANEKIVVFYIPYDGGATSGDIVGVVGTISEDTISFGAEVVINAGSHAEINAVYDAASGKIVVCSGGGDAWVVTVSGTTFTFGATATFNGGSSTLYPKIVSANGTIAIAYYDSGATDVEVVAATISGTTLTFGTPATVYSAQIDGRIGFTYDIGNDKLVITYCSHYPLSVGYGVVCSISGTTVTVGTPVIYNAANVGTNGEATYDEGSGKIFNLSWINTGSWGTYLSVGTVTGMTISFASIFDLLDSDGGAGYNGVYSPTHGGVVFVRDSYNASMVQAIIIASQVTNIQGPTGITPEGGSYLGLDEVSLALCTNVNRLVVTYQDSSDYLSYITLVNADAVAFWCNYVNQYEISS